MLCSSRFCLPPVFFGYQNVLIDISNASYRIGFHNLDIIQDIGYDRFIDLGTTASSMWERTARIRTRKYDRFIDLGTHHTDSHPQVIACPNE